ncbi:uncharacterized protein LOC130645491 [Hydractinia symbiolongicarpus]|uniref:uncharacterized protein LOC130645491 n=1 Tax=Hydractinia symbiolongicarpus TaxID=13093 RepID=UPI0025511465|nr:uncharacterized protein LOC130645491 [Hydractinia symbiolongicarpus]
MGSLETIFFPPLLSQSTLGDANGSNACVVISLLLGFAVKKSNYELDFSSWSALKDILLPIYCGAIDIGNYLYRTNKKSGFLHTAEALQILSSNMLSLTEERNVFFGTRDNSLLSYISDKRSECNDVVVVKGVAMSVFIDHTRIIFIDTHRNDQRGGKICSAKKLDFENLCKVFNFTIPNDEVIYICSVLINGE